jgi:hypothetical protein
VIVSAPLGEGGQLSLAQDAAESGSLSTAALDSGQLRIANSEERESPVSEVSYIFR